MLYENYRKRILKIANILKTVKRFRVLILSVLGTALVLTAVCLGVRGIVYDSVPCPYRIVYGEEITYEAKAVFGRVRYEYAAADSDEWTAEYPQGVGEYKVRGVSSRIFGAPSYGKSHAFSIVPKDIRIEAAVGGSVVYGDLPEVSAELAFGDRIECSDFEYRDLSEKTTEVRARAEAIVVYDASGRDVTDFYVIDTPFCEVAFTPRPITVTLPDAEHVYDGEAFSSDLYEVSEGGLAFSDEAILSFGRSRTEVGRTKNEAEVKIVGKDGADVTGNYEIRQVTGDLIVTKRPVEVSVSGAEKEYDGTPLFCTDYSVQTPPLAGHEIFLDSYTELTDAGVVENKLFFSVRDGDGGDLTENYAIECECGELKVIRRQISVRTESAEKEYDGKPLVCGGYEILPGKEIAEGHGLALSFSGEQTAAGISENTVSKAEVFTDDGADVTGNYDIAFEYGELKVTRRQISVKTDSMEWVYDGRAHSCTDYEILSEKGFAEGQTAEAADPQTLVFCGSAENAFSLRVFVGQTETTDCYEISYTYGRLAVTPRPLTIRAGSAEKEYDGEPLTFDGCTAFDAGDQSFVFGELHMAEAVLYGSQTDAGEGENKVLRALIRSISDGADVTDNFVLAYETGVLKVTPRFVAIEAGSAEKEYDGTPLTCAEYEVISEKTFVSGHSPSVLIFGSQTDAGESENAIRGVKVFGADGGDVTKNYQIGYRSGVLAVTPRPITVGTGSAEKMYDGTPLTCAEYGVISEKKLVNGHRLSVGLNSAQTDVGKKENRAFSADVFTADGKAVTFNYEISFEYGELEVTLRPITVETGGNEWIYNGEERFEEAFAIVSEIGLADGEVCFVLENTKIREAGETSNLLALGITGAGGDATKNYEITYINGILRVTPRPILAISLSAEKMYDGLALFRTAFSISCRVGDGLTLAKGDSIREIDLNRQYQLDVGERPNEIRIAKIYFEQDRDVTASYEISYQYGTLKVTPRPITVAADSAGKYYDGTPLTANTCTVVSEIQLVCLRDSYGRVLFEDTMVATTAGSQTEVGTSGNAVRSVRIFNRSGEDATGNYDITYETGFLTVEKRPITIETGSADKIYDGTPLVSDEYRIVSGFPLVVGHRAEVVCSGSQTEIGESRNPAEVTILDSAGRDVTDCYSVRVVPGILNVHLVKIRYSTGSAEKVFDGKPLANGGLTIHEGQALEGHTLSVRTASSITFAGSCLNEIVYQVTDETGKDVSEYYYFEVVETGILTVYPIRLTFSTGSAEKDYDGTPLTCDTWTPIDGKLLEGHTASVAVTGRITEPGAVKNTAELLWVSDEAGNDMTGGYKAIWDYGLLIVRGSQGGGSGGGVYDGSGEISRNPGSGGGGSGDKTVAFKVTADSDGTMYFRMESYGDYEGSYGWLKAQPYYSDGEINPLFFATLALLCAGYNLSSADVEAVAKIPFVLPYYAVEADYGTADDTRVLFPDWEKYTVSYVSYSYESGKKVSLTGTPYETLERIYRQFVYGNYLQLPDYTKSVLLDVAKRKGLDAGSSTIIEDVAKLVRNAVTYDLDFEEYTGDLAVYFFTQAKTGICQHYATAATAMYRALGIPARYVGGFISAVKAGETVEVTMDKAHAWVEVYLDGMGWVAVEVTGSYGGGSGTGGSGTELVEQKLMIKPKDVDKEYDGTPLYALNVVEDAAGLNLEELLAKGYTYRVVVSGSQTDYGESQSVIEEFILYDYLGRDVTKEFSIVYVKGRIRITKTQIVVSVYSLQKYYDGTPLSYAPDDYRIVEIPENYRLELELKGSLTEVGVLSLTLLSDLPMTVYDEAGRDVTENYYVKFIGDPLRVDKRSIEITSISRSKEYDGEPLRDDRTWVSKGSLAEGEALSVTVVGEVTDVGETENKIVFVKIFDSEGNEVTENYTIVCKNGTLSVVD